MMAESTIEHTELKRCDLLKLIGRFDSSQARPLGERFEELTANSRYCFVLDLSETLSFSSAVLREVLVAQTKARQWHHGGDVYLAALSPRIAEILDLTGLVPLFKVYDTVEEAVGAW